MSRTPYILGTIAALAIAAPATAGGYEHSGDRIYSGDSAEIVVTGGIRPPAPNDDTNSYWLDYKTDVSEAGRELDSDLRGADDAEDKRRAYAEYEREISDARDDYAKEMGEKGYRVASFRQDHSVVLSLR